jgi:hypothetical protein
MGQRGRSGSWEVVVIARREREREREREEVVEVVANDATWRRSCGDAHTTTLNRGNYWFSDGEMIPGTRRRDWSRGGCGG